MRAVKNNAGKGSAFVVTVVQNTRFLLQMIYTGCTMISGKHPGPAGIPVRHIGGN